MSKSIRIKRTIRATNVEELYKELANQDDDTIDLILPKEISSNDIGLLQSLIQFVATWVRGKNSGKVLVDIKDDEEEISDFINQEFAYTTIVLCWYKDILRLSNLRDLKPRLKPYTKKIQQAMQSLLEITGQKLLLTCFDHIPSKNGLLNCFYEAGTFITSDVHLSFSLTPALSKVLSFNKSAAAKSIGPILDELVGIIFELMKNTDEWGRTDIQNSLLNPSVRGVYVRFLKKNVNSLMDLYTNNQCLENYFDSLTTNNAGETYFLEVSVFDSGVGFIDRYQKKSAAHYSVAEQVQIIKQCLIKNNTSAIGLKKDSKGLGLDRILNTINHRGLFWIRTGNVSLFRNLKSNPHKEQQGTGDIALTDWQKNSHSAFTELPQVAGSCITIVQPISLSNE